MAMNWTKTYPDSYKYDGRIKYVCGEYSIMRGNEKNIWTGKPMSEQVWNIKKNGQEVGWGFTLKEAKAEAEAMMEAETIEEEKESKEMAVVTKNAEQVLDTVNGMITDLENGMVWNNKYRIADVYDELNIFDWWNDNLSKTQLKDMQKFLKEAIKLGYTGYVCFKVGATGCANGMWAYKAESTTGHSPHSACLYKSFTPAYNYWSFYNDEDNTWTPALDGDYDSIKTIAQLEKAIDDMQAEKLAVELEAENKLGKVGEWGMTKAEYINYLIDKGYNRSDAEWEASRYDWSKDTIDLANGVTIANGEAYVEDDIICATAEDELVELEGCVDDLYEAQAEIDWQAEQAQQESTRLTETEYRDYLMYNQGFSFASAERYAKELYAERDKKMAKTGEKQPLKHIEYGVHFVSTDGSEEHIGGHFTNKNEALQSACRKRGFGNRDVYIVKREVTEWSRA